MKHRLTFRLSAILSFLLLSTLLTKAFASPHSGRDVKEFEKTVDLANDGRLRLDTFKGSIKISAWNREEVQIYAKIEADESVSRDYAEESVEATEVRVRESGSSVSIKSDYDDVPSESSLFGFGQSKVLPYVHYEIRAPKNIRLTVDDYKSEIRLDGFDGRIYVESYKGTLDAEQMSGELEIDTYKGEFSVADFRGSIEAKTYKGEIIVDLLELDGRSRLETSKGYIRINAPSSLRADLVAELGKRADFRSDFDIPRSRSSRRWRDDDEQDFQASINGGGPELYLKSTKGTIRLSK